MAGCECCDNFSMIDGGDEFKAFPGLKGDDGTTFYPHVSAEGVLSWTNDGGKPNPDPVNIKGADGKSAYQAAVEAGFSGTESELNEYLSNIGDLTDEVADQKSALTALTSIVFNPSDWEIGSLSLNGKTVNEISSTTRIRSGYIPVNTGTILTVADSANCLYVFEFGDAHNYLRQNAGGNWATTRDLGEDTRFVRVLIRKSASNPTISDEEISAQVARLSGTVAVDSYVWLVDNFDNETYAQSIVDANSAEQAVTNGFANLDMSFSWQEQTYITGTGALGFSSGMYYSGAIRIPTGSKSFIYTFSKTSKAAELRWIQYDSSRTIISGTYGSSTSSGSGEVEIAENAKILAFSIGNWNNLYPQDEVVSSLSVKFPTLISDTLSGGNIVARCREQVANVFTGACAYRARNADGISTKNFALLMMSDTHGDDARVANAIKLLENCGAIDAAIHLGDAHNSNYNDGTAAKTITAMNKATKPVLAVMGNHDGRQKNTTNCTVEQAVSAFLGQTKLASIYEDRGYGFYDFAGYKIRIIMLNAYDFPNDKSGNNYVYYGDSNMYRQAQIDWFVSTLNSTPDDYTVIVAEHYIEPTTLDLTTIPQHVGTANVVGLSNTRGKNGQMSGTVISDIINAFVEKTTLSQSYTYVTAGAETGVTVSADFSARESSNFACYIVGHTHCQAIGHITGHNSQVVYINDTSCLFSNNNGSNMWPSAWSLIPRASGQKSEDLLTVLCIDTANRKLNLVRVGANMNMFGEDYDIVNYSY